MRVVVVSDAHLVGLDDPNQALLVRWLDALLTVGLDELILLGDIFHHWWGFSGVVMTDYVPICAALLRVKAAGVTIRFVPGNHDFHVGDYFSKTLEAEVTGPVRLTLSGRSFFLAHGDEADTSWRYTLTRTILRGALFAGIMRLLGPVLGGAFLQKLAGSSRDHMGDQQRLLERQREWATPHLQAGAEFVVMGHVHWPGVVAMPEGTVVHLGDWVSHHTFLLIESGEVSLRGLVELQKPLGEPVRPAPRA
ncbi:MAG: UDP-2,3-diacylglucosamine diphosphatase [Myxococcota bacterium]|nr:UDP-2,3-diacylglucosamine diphosphatase [Myxococcota bacterium]